MKQQVTCHISGITKLLGMSCDTLRYYERVGLLKNIQRTQGGLRCYTKDNVSQLQFIQRAKSMGFTLDVIKQLVSFRDNPKHCSARSHNLVLSKIKLIEDKSRQLKILHHELTSILELHG